MQDARLWYGLVYDPCAPYIDNVEVERVCGDLADDLGDICSDVVPSLLAYEKDPEKWATDVHWDWAAGCFNLHWGVHLQHAMTALHLKRSEVHSAV